MGGDGKAEDGRGKEGGDKEGETRTYGSKRGSGNEGWRKSNGRAERKLTGERKGEGESHAFECCQIESCGYQDD